MKRPEAHMNRRVFPWQSLKFRVTLFTLAIFLSSLWALSFYATQVLRKDMERFLGEQQFSTATLVAAEIDREMAERTEALELIADLSQQHLLNGPATMQKYLEERTIFRTLFNGGAFVLAADGTAVADIPGTNRRIGINYIDRDYAIGALHEGRSSVGRPVLSRDLEEPVVALASPIRDSQGRIIGAIVGVINLGLSSFLDHVTEKSYGRTGSYLIISPKYRQIVTTLDKRRNLEELPPAGANPAIDRFLDGHEGSGVVVNPRGEEALASAKHIPSADWLVVVHLPTDEAFAPIREMQVHMWLGTCILTLLAGWLSYWQLRRELSPMLGTIRTLSTMSETHQGLSQTPLPIGRHDEIGELIGAFNRLLNTLGQRERSLKESEERYRALTDCSPDAHAVHRDGRLLYVNPSAVRKLGAHIPDELLGRSILEFLHLD